MRLTVKVLPLKQGPASSLNYQPAISRGPPPAQFALPIDPDTTIDEIWRRIEARYTRNYLTQQQAQTFKIKKLKDAYGSDLDINDIAGALFAEETSENRVIQVEQEFFGREVSIPPTSNLRPQPLSHKRAAEPHENNIHKRARRAIRNNSDHLSQLPPIPNSQFDNIILTPAVTSIREIPQGISQDEVIADSHPQNADVNGFSDDLGAKSEPLDESLTLLHAIPESNNSSSRGSPLLGEDASHRSGNSLGEEDPDEVTTPESNGESDDVDDDDDNDDERSSNVSEARSGSYESSNGQRNQIWNPPYKSTPQGPYGQPNSDKVSSRVHNLHSANSTPQAFPSSGLGSTNVATKSGGNLLGMKKVKRVLSFSPPQDHGQLVTDSAPKNNSMIATRKVQQVVDRGSIYSISSKKSSRLPSEEVTLRHNHLGSISKKAQTPSQHRSSVATLERVEVPRPFSSTSQSEAWRPGAIDQEDCQRRASSNLSLRNALTMIETQPSAPKHASKWTPEEVSLLLKAHHEGRDPKDIASTLLPSRSIGGCRKKLRYLTQGTSTAADSHGKKGAGDVTDNQDEENERDDISINGPSVSPRARTPNVHSLTRSKVENLENSSKQASNGKLSKPGRQNEYNGAPPSSDNSKVNPILIPDQTSLNSREDDEDYANGNSDAGLTIVQRNGDIPSSQKPVKKHNDKTLPLVGMNSKTSAAQKLQIYSKQSSRPEKQIDELGHIQSQPSRNGASPGNHDRIASVKPNNTPGQLQRAKVDKSKGSESRSKGVKSLPNKPRQKEKTKDLREADIDHVLEDDLQNQLRQNHSVGVSPSKSPSNEASPNTDDIASSPPDVPVSDKSKILTPISKQPSSQKTSKLTTNWLKKDQRSPSILLWKKFNEAKKSSPNQTKSSNLQQSRLPSYRKLSDMGGPELISNSFKISRSGSGSKNGNSSSGNEDDDGDDDEDDSNDSESESASSSSSSSGSDTNEKTATQVWQQEGMSGQPKEGSGSSKRYARLTGMLSRFSQPSSTV